MSSFLYRYARNAGVHEILPVRFSEKNGGSLLTLAIIPIIEKKSVVITTNNLQYDRIFLDSSVQVC